MSFKKKTRETKKEKTELYMACLSKASLEIDDKRIKSAKQIKVSDHFKEPISAYADVFKQDLPDALPPKRTFEFEILTNESKPPASCPVIRLSLEEQKDLQKKVDELLKRSYPTIDVALWGSIVLCKKEIKGSKNGL